MKGLKRTIIMKEGPGSEILSLIDSKYIFHAEGIEIDLKSLNAESLRLINKTHESVIEAKRNNYKWVDGGKDRIVDIDMFISHIEEIRNVFLNFIKQ